MLLSKIKRHPYKISISRTFLTCGFSRRLCTMPKLLSDSLKSGRIREAEELFDKIPDKDIVLWSVLIHGYSVNGLYKNSLESFFKMRRYGLVPNSFTFVGVLVGVRYLPDTMRVRYFHGLILKCGFESDSVVGTALLDAYAKSRNIWDSLKTFQGLKYPSTVSHNAMISGFNRNEMFEEGVVFFNRFRRNGLIPNASTMLSVIQCCIGLGINVVSESVHGLVLKTGFVSVLTLNNALLDMYVCLMDSRSTIAIFNTMQRKDVITWTVMIGLLINLEYVHDALRLFIEMRTHGIALDDLVILNLISACVLLGDFKRGREVHAQSIVSGFDSEIHLGNSLIAMYSKFGDLKCSSAVFLRMKRRSLVSWTAMMTGFLENGQAKEALVIFMLTNLNNYFVDSVMMVNGITASGEICAYELCLQLHCFSFHKGFSNYRQIQNCFISAYSKCASMDFAFKIFTEMGSLRNLISWNSMINGYGMNGQGEISLALYYSMRNINETPDLATYLCVLSACSHAGLVQEGVLVFCEMLKNSEIAATEEHYGCLVDLLARSGRLTEASEFIQESAPGLGSNFLKHFLSGSALNGNAELAEIVAKELDEIDSPESSQVVLLSNIYALKGRFLDAENLRSNRMRKTPGFSLCASSYDLG